jgi:hypothetical protein
MPETKKKLPFLGFEIEVSEVPVIRADEQLSTYVLEDGSVIKVRNVATSIMRVEGQYLPDGSPVYFILVTPVTSVVESKLKGEKKLEKGKPN